MAAQVGARVAWITPLRIFHISAICNLTSIAKAKALYAKTRLSRKGMSYGNIAYQGAQDKRAAKIVTKPPAGTIHDYVPFYFAPRSPMLYTVNFGNVPDCPHRQQDIIHFMTTVETVVENALPFVFYDYNATLDIATCYSDLGDLRKINWPLFHETPCLDGYCKYFHDDRNKPKYMLRRETRQAEFLVHEKVPLEAIRLVGTYDETKAEQVRQIFRKADLGLKVEAKPEWYF